MATFRLKLEGHASVTHPAQRAYVHLTVAAEDHEKQAVDSIVLSTVHSVESLIGDIKTQAEPETVPITYWSKTSQNFHSSQVWAGRQAAKVQLDICFRDFEALGKFIARTLAIEHCEVKVDWMLISDTQKRIEGRLRKEAAADALDKAKEYCSIPCTESVSRIIPVNMGPETVSKSFYQRLKEASGRASDSSSVKNKHTMFTPPTLKLATTLQVDFKAEFDEMDSSTSDTEQGQQQFSHVSLVDQHNEEWEGIA